MDSKPDSTEGIFLTLEGDDGVGKSTQADLLASWVEQQGLTVLRVHEPGGTRLGEKIRTLLLDKDDDAMTPLAELLLFEAARAQVMDEVIEPALARGEVVVCDRFTDSTLAYQGYGRELGASLVRSTNDLACGGRYPDRTLLLVLDDDVARGRVENRSADGAGDRMESAGDAFRARLRGGFDEIAASEPERVHAIDANGSVEQVHERICTDLADLLSTAGAGAENQTKLPRRHLSCSADSGAEERS